MSDDEFEEGDVELDEDALEEEDLEEDEAIDEDLELGDDVDLELGENLEGEETGDGAGAAGAAAAVVETPIPADKAVREPDEEDEDVLDLDEELHPDDVEAPLDALLQERTASATLEDEEEEVEEEEADVDEPGERPTKIVPRRPGEFLCSSCFLVLPRNQLADEKRMLCRDCA
ncbi:MAG TPA: DUF4193 family protein [Acidimicrobiia bacterium]|nr:DUF4193 family protein [Acidimicrobiia bacterium]